MPPKKIQMSELKLLQVQIETLTKEINEFVEFVDSLDLENISESNMLQLKRKLQQVESFLKDYREISIKLSCYDQPVPSQCYKQFSEQFIYATAKADQIIAKFNSTSNPNSPNIQSMVSSEAAKVSSNSIKVPKINLPTFDGQYKNWTGFKDVFVSSVHNNPNINSDVERFLLLKSALRGPALEVVDNVPPSNEGYKTAWAILNKRYDNKKLLIQDHIRSIVDYPNITKECHSQLRALLNNFNKNLRALENLGRSVTNDSDFVSYIIVSKFDNNTKRHFSEYSKNISDPPNIQHITNFLESRCELLEDIERHKPNQIKFEPKTQQKTITQQHAVTTINQSCVYCKGNHNIYQCQTFLALDQNSRFSFVKDKKLCVNCLKPKHSVQECKSQFACRNCKRKHHTLLHIDLKTKSETEINNSSVDTSQHVNSKNSSEVASVQQTTLTNHVASSQVLLSTAIINVVDSEGNLHSCRALLDSGSQSNLITESCCTRLKLPKTNIDFKVSGINSSLSNISHSTNVKISSQCTSFEANLHCLVITNITGKIPNQSFDKTTLTLPRDTTLADPDFNLAKPIDLLIGASLFWHLLLIGRISLGKGNPILQKTRLGWIVCGPVYTSFVDGPRNQTYTHCSLECSNSLDNSLTRFWKIDEPQMSCTGMSEEERSCEQHFLNTVKRNPVSGRFIVTVPFKDSLTKLGDSRQIALQRFQSLERKLDKNPQLKEQYVKFMTEYESMGHMSKVDEYQTSYQTVVYIPHHPVIKESSLSTKLRVVFDASCKSDSGISLNEIQMVGPVVQDDLFSILLRFRQHSFVLTADVKMMYRQILIDPNQRSLQRIFWRQNSFEKLNCFELNTVTYGTSSAPYLATKCLQHLANENMSRFPKASSVIKNDMYVDDLLTGSDSLEDLRDVRDSVSHILSTAQFHLRKFLSNCSNILDDIRSEEINNELHVLNLGDNENNKTLGVIWNASSDRIQYIIKDLSFKPPTLSKRVILSTISSIFDPLGLLSPVILSAKMLIQSLWQRKVSWDDEVPHDLKTVWLKLSQNLNTLNDLRVSRHVILPNSVSVELHAFCDASEKGYGTCIYLKSITSSGTISVQLLCSKSRVAPLRQCSLPRLELCGAVLLAQLVRKVVNSLTLNIVKFYYWCDSTIALAWIKSPSSKWKTFIANRVAEIQGLTNTDAWYHVKSELNPADLASRGTTPEFLLNSSLWWHGPEFIAQPELKLSSTLIPNIDSCPEQRSVRTGTLNINLLSTNITHDLDIFTKYSSFMKLVRITAYCRRFKSNTLENKHKKNLGSLTTSEIQLAMTGLIKLAQIQSFEHEVKCFLSKKPISNKSKIASLNPFMDADNIIRVGGRLNYSKFNFSKKHPILLSPKHPLTRLIMQGEHIRLMHCGPQSLLASIRERFWPISGRNLARQIVRNCIKCFKTSPAMQNHPIMGNLPSCRTRLYSVFNEAGIDYAGPFSIKDRKLRGSKLIKGYVALFICLSTKAVHLELVTDLTTDAFIATFRRFVSRRGRPCTVYSDNGTNFTGAKSELQDLSRFLQNSSNQSIIIDNSTSDNIDWQFIPPHSPNFGGIWEAGVKAMKFHLKRVIGNANLTYEDFQTVLVQVEAILNSRPLSPLSSSPDDYNPLTPGHFLIGKPLMSLPDHDLLNIKEGRLERFQRLQQLCQHIWSRWSKEYISELQSRQKWKTNYTNLLKVGALVLVKEDHLPPLKWQLGRVVALHPGKDNITRVVTIKTASSTIKRSISKVVVLPTD